MSIKIQRHPLRVALLFAVVCFCLGSGWGQPKEGFDCVGAKSIFADWALAIQTGPKEEFKVPPPHGEHISIFGHAPDGVTQAILDAVHSSRLYFEGDEGLRTLRQIHDYVNDPNSAPLSFFTIVTSSIDDLDDDGMYLAPILTANQIQLTSIRQFFITYRARVAVGYHNDSIRAILLTFEANQIDILPFMASQLLRMSFVADERTVFELQSFFNQYILISNEYCPEWLTNPVTIPFSINQFEGVD